MTARLKLVDQAPAPTDITLALRKEITARDWSRVHIEGDRRKPVVLPDRVSRWWLR